MQERRIMSLHCSFVLPFVCEAAHTSSFWNSRDCAVPAWLGIQVNSAAAQTFNERWSIIPKAHAEPAPEAPNQTRQNPLEQHPTAEPTRRQEDRSAPRSSNRVFSGKASYYAYPTGKTASGSSFNRDSLTAAHRNLPFGARVIVTDLARSKSVVVRYHRPGTLGSRPRVRPFTRRCAQFGDYAPRRGPGSR